MRAAPRCRPNPPVCLQGEPEPVVTALEAVMGDQRLVQVLDAEIPVAGVEQLQHRHHLIDRRPSGRNLAQPAVIEPVRSLGLKPAPPAPKRPLRDPKDLRRFLLAQRPGPGPAVNLLELHPAYPLD